MQVSHFESELMKLPKIQAVAIADFIPFDACCHPAAHLITR